MKSTNKQLLLAVWLSVLVIFTAILIGKVGEYNERVQEREVKALVTEQLDCLAKNIYYEANAENFEGKLAVAQVTMNRANSGIYPSDVCGVVKQKVNGTCQFSWFCMDHATLPGLNKYAWQECQMIAKKVLLGELEHHELKARRAMNYHATYVSPDWSATLVKVKQIGQHVFYVRKSVAT